ncbi:MAG: gas vesicle protein [Solirubrobacterales bacterium]|nr:gas vesicle protein [Solirubrobacterales bacterium]
MPQAYGRSDLRPRENTGPANLADILERVLDKGIVIAGDIQINLLEIELLTIKLRLLVASVDRAQEMGINWWQSDPRLSTDAQKQIETETVTETVTEPDPEVQELRERLDRLERLLESGESKRGSGASSRRSGGRRGDASSG